MVGITPEFRVRKSFDVKEVELLEGKLDSLVKDIVQSNTWCQWCMLWWPFPQRRIIVGGVLRFGNILKKHESYFWDLFRA